MNTQIETASNREIEGLSLLNQFKSTLVEIDINVGGIVSTSFMDKLDFENQETNLMLEDIGNVESIGNIHILKEQILEIEQEYSGCITIYMINGNITITKL